MHWQVSSITKLSEVHNSERYSWTVLVSCLGSQPDPHIGYWVHTHRCMSSYSTTDLGCRAGLKDTHMNKFRCSTSYYRHHNLDVRDTRSNMSKCSKVRSWVDRYNMHMWDQLSVKLEPSKAHTAAYVYPALIWVAPRWNQVCEYVDNLYQHTTLHLCAWAESTWPAVDRCGQ